MKEVMRFKVPMVGPSLNSWYSQAHWSKRSAHKKAWRGYFHLKSREFPKIQNYPIIVETVTYFKTNRRRDCDNWITANKLLCDSLVDIGVMEDDSSKYISKQICSIYQGNSNEDYTEVIIYETEFTLT